MASKKFHNHKRNSNHRKILRSNLTPAEAFLWKHLKSRQLFGRRFIKQHGIGNYIVDFYCASERLIIELDGEVHNTFEAQEYDAKRTEYLNSLNFKVIRFENKLVFDFLPAVLTEISNYFKEQ